MTAEFHKYDGGILPMNEAGLIGDFYDPEMHQFAAVTRPRGMGFLVFPETSVRKLINMDNDSFELLIKQKGIAFKKGYVKHVLGASSLVGT